ncbi:LEAF RUST 10 DISEASE-RESISTANCE LOCUS RECEPTOR-LIKE PROTEIN KINASE-like 2.5 isoform X2 [Arachis ipaensis]|uniref:LEAF RUST 10 DISEASE-RESISTANCE LOCUS RECEPTOR-LIKE PROTEIN KINASE-like 2.5 isoform X2 n=1 Tax=Arachis ipaensis TaxID=130454 RepID=UPI000A2B24FC|nr:LEAF RUST 10 DISEASE-RESISTANCE LOCUS RECEPTOR-LIKE PROTEIN KINASE-like 2.5 isoform X2 [Arachis ipaensis]
MVSFPKIQHIIHCFSKSFKKMARPLLLLPPLPPSFVKAFVFFSSLLLPTYSAGDVKGYTDCAPFTCGTFKNISYPFWNSNQPDYCGHPRFKLDCQQDQVTINIKSQKFDVIDIDQNSQSLKIARFDLYNDPCSRDNTNVSLDNDFFKFTSNDGNITLVYDCDPPSYWSDISFKYFGMFNCSIYGGDPSAAYLVLMENLGVIFDMGCKFIIVPALAKDILSFNNYALNNGFEVGWSGVNETLCDSCKQSGGRCGHNASLNEFICFCRNNQQTYGGICSNSSLSQSPTLSAPIPSEPLSSPYPGPLNYPDQGAKRNHWRWIVIVAASVVGVLALAMAFGGKLHCSPAAAWHYSSSGVTITAIAVIRVLVSCFTCKLLRLKSNRDIETFLKNHRVLTLKRYKFSDVKKMTNSFKVKLGQGGFGAVYKGKLRNGSDVAVKILNQSKGNGEDFINEVASISRTSHVNVVTLLGFCLDGHKKVLIYEFMSNGSLDKFIYKKEPKNTPLLSWDNLYQISIGIARGLEYLHRGCNIRILHFDIKPHNILLDENFCPKISDFGLAKLCPRKESHISMSETRGTIGYIAPEMWNRYFDRVSHKSDVYSYGMMLLEMVGMKEKNIIAETSQTSEMYFPDWIYKSLEQGTQVGPKDEELSMEENDVVKKMTVVGLWCIQPIPSDRPTMSKVVEMLEGSMNSLEIPPRGLSSPIRVVIESSTVVPLVESSSIVSVVESSTGVESSIVSNTHYNLNVFTENKNVS